MDRAGERVVQMKAYDAAAQDRIDELQSALDATDIEIEELEQKLKEREQVIKSLQMERDQILCG